LNQHGALVKKFGMKILVHNHAGEFDLLDDGKTTQYDLLLAETDPELVAMQLDIGWAYVAGQDAPAMFRKNPGRFELWHVKDAKYKELDPNQTPSQAHAEGENRRVGRHSAAAPGSFRPHAPAATPIALSLTRPGSIEHASLTAFAASDVLGGPMRRQLLKPPAQPPRARTSKSTLWPQDGLPWNRAATHISRPGI
jgi:hypothetical protein